MKRLTLTAFLFFSYNSLCAIPSVEGLFRNSSNREIVAEGVRISYSIEELLQKVQVETVEGPLEEELLKKKSSILYVKESISISEGGDSLRSIKYLFDSSEMNSKDMLGVRFIPNYASKIINEHDINKRVLYSLSTMLIFNKSDIIGSLLRDKGNDYKNNKKMLNAEKMKLLESYKEYLVATKEDPALRKELASPLSPVDREENDRVLELMKKNMYQNSGQVKLVREQGEFRWRVDLGTIQADFSNEEHRLKKISVQDTGIVEATVGDYVLFDGVHELPRIIFLKGKNGRVYKIRFLKLKYYEKFKNSFNKQVKNLDKVESEIKLNGKVYNIHPLIL